MMSYNIKSLTSAGLFCCVIAACAANQSGQSETPNTLNENACVLNSFDKIDLNEIELDGVWYGFKPHINLEGCDNVWLPYDDPIGDEGIILSRLYDALDEAAFDNCLGIKGRFTVSVERDNTTEYGYRMTMKAISDLRPACQK